MSIIVANGERAGRLGLAFSLAAAVFCAVGAALAEEEGTQSAPAQAAEEEGEATDAVGVNLDLGFATHYVFRGLNLYMEDEQLDPHMLLAPGVSWSVAATGLTLGWWAAFQLNGNVRANIDAGYGLEHDLYATYDFELSDSVGLGLQMYAYLYPFADEDVTMTRGAPVWLEPGAYFAWSTAVDLGVVVTYMAGVQDALHEGNYLYLSPGVGKSFELAEPLTLGLVASFGYKAWFHSEDKVIDNTFDLGAKVDLTWYATDAFYLKPAAGFAWTNFDGLGFADEYIVYGALNLGVDL